jgi:hypothetical protein
LNNAGIISAESPAELTLGLGGGGLSPTNNGTLSAINGGHLFLEGPTLLYNNGTISAMGRASPRGVASDVDIANDSIVGGQLLTDATGLIRITSGISALSDVQVNGNLQISAGTNFSNVTVNGSVTSDATVTFSNTITINGNWDQTPLDHITFAGNLLLNGNGTLSFPDAGFGPSASSTLTIASGLTLVGSGVLGGTPVALINNGQIVATSSTTLYVTAGTSFRNAGLLSAANGAMQLTGPFGVSSTLDNSNGTISATGKLEGGYLSEVFISNYTISGGLLTTDATGKIYLSNTSLSDLKTSGALISVGPLTLQNDTLGGSLIAGNVSVSGAVTCNAAFTSNGTLSLANNVIFTASGVTTVQAIVLASTASYVFAGGALIVTDPSSISTLQSEIAQGANHAAGIFSIVPNTVLSLVNNASLPIPFTTFDGAPVGAKAILITPALLGDTDLSGTVDANDLNTVLQNLGTTTPNWTLGNFDHAPTIDLTDLNDVLNNLGQTFSTGSAAAPTLPAPEPASLSILGAAGLLFARRSRGHVARC